MSKWPPTDAHEAVSLHGNTSGEAADHGAPVAAPEPAPAPVVTPMTDGGPGIPPAEPAQQTGG